MDAGKLNERVKLLRLAADGTKYQWAEAGKLWAAAEQKEKTNLFSSVGIGARSAEFIVRRCGLTLRDAFLWRGKHCFLTSIVDEGKLHWRIAAALIEPAACAATRPEKGKDEQGKLCYTQKPLCLFPGFLTEKYLGFVQREPQGQVEHRLVLVTPKAVTLKTGDLVNTDGGVYAVRVCYLLDEFKNEYEIANTKEP